MLKPDAVRERHLQQLDGSWSNGRDRLANFGPIWRKTSLVLTDGDMKHTGGGRYAAAGLLPATPPGKPLP